MVLVERFRFFHCNTNCVTRGGTRHSQKPQSECIWCHRCHLLVCCCNFHFDLAIVSGPVVWPASAVRTHARLSWTAICGQSVVVDDATALRLRWSNEDCSTGAHSFNVSCCAWSDQISFCCITPRLPLIGDQPGFAVWQLLSPSMMSMWSLITMCDPLSRSQWQHGQQHCWAHLQCHWLQHVSCVVTRMWHWWVEMTSCCIPPLAQSVIQKIGTG